MITKQKLQKVLDSYHINVSIDLIIEMWKRPERFYHHANVHLEDLLNKIEKLTVPTITRNKLYIVALFHDIIYDPYANDNEINSHIFFMNKSINKESKITYSIGDTILDTIDHRGSTPFSRLFQELDMSVALGSLPELLRWEDGIRNEQCYNPLYRTKRIDFIYEMSKKYPQNATNLLILLGIVKRRF